MVRSSNGLNTDRYRTWCRWVRTKLGWRNFEVAYSYCLIRHK